MHSFASHDEQIDHVMTPKQQVDMSNPHFLRGIKHYWSLFQPLLNLVGEPHLEGVHKTIWILIVNVILELLEQTWR